MTMAATTAITPPSSSMSSTPAAVATDASTTANDGSDGSNNNSKQQQQQQQQQQHEEVQKRKRREKLLRRAIPILLTVPWFLGLLWTALHPLVSVITGELKCRGQYIDENGLDVHRHRIESYPLERSMSKTKIKRWNGASADDEDESRSTGLCDAIYSNSMSISPSIECLRHEATETVAFDVVRVLPSMGPMIESTEAVVILVGTDENKRTDGEEDEEEDWYGNDLNASILHLIKKLGRKEDCPWLTKTVFIVSHAKNVIGNTTVSSAEPSLNNVVDAFITSYLGGSNSIGSSVRPLPPEFTFPMIRSVLVLSDIAETDETTPSPSSTSTTRTEVRILPQGTGGALPNLDLVFATYTSFQSYPLGKQYNPSQSIYYGDTSDIRAHPFGGALEERVGKVLRGVGNVFGLKSADVEKYAKDLAGLLGFVAGLVIGPRQPHASALNHGIDALTIEVRIPGDIGPSYSSIHPHYADLARCVEHLLRSISNLHERLHHSVAQYTMPSPSKFVSHGEYIYPALLVSLPMIVRAATLALRDLGRFQFVHVGMVVGSVCIMSSAIGVWSFIANQRHVVEDSTSQWVSYLLFFMAYMFVVLVARQDHTLLPQMEAGTNKRIKHNAQSNKSDYHGSLRFTCCLVGIYLHAPMLLANYSLGFPSSVFWSPLLASLVLPLSVHSFLLRNNVLAIFVKVAQCLFLIATSPPIVLVPRIFQWYTPYIIGVYTPLHLLLAALWLS